MWVEIPGHETRVVVLPNAGCQKGGVAGKGGDPRFQRNAVNPQGAMTAAIWVVQSGVLGQFSMANEQLYGKLEENVQ